MPKHQHIVCTCQLDDEVRNHYIEGYHRGYRDGLRRLKHVLDREFRKAMEQVERQEDDE